jgi:DNA polymerase I-like protein with 3'-5' exonuclease and polymerase domains
VDAPPLGEALKPEVLRYPDMAQKYHEEMELALTLLDMETAGLGTRPEYVDEKVREYRKRVVEHDLGIEQIVGKPVRTGHIPPKERALYFNPASSQELAEFFRSRGFDRESYNKEALAGIDHPLARALGARRKDAKLLSTYFLAIQREQRNNVLHPSFRQNVATGRMSSGQSEG